MADATDLMGFPYEEAARLVGISEARIRRIIGTGVHEPAHESTILSFRDLVALRTIARLKSHGVRLKKMREVYAYLRDYARESWAQLVVGVAPNKRIGFKNPNTGEWELADISKQLLAEFSIAEVALEMAEKVKRARQRKTEDVGHFGASRGVMGGVECFRGTRIPKSVIIEYINDGATDDKILSEYPSLTASDIEAVRKLAL